MRRFLTTPFRIAALLALMILAMSGAPAQAAQSTQTKEAAVIQIAAKRMACPGTRGFVDLDPVYLATCSVSGNETVNDTGIRLERYATAEQAASALAALGSGFAGQFHDHPAKRWYQQTAAGVRGYHAWQADQWLITSTSYEGDLTTATKSMLSFSETLHAVAVEQGLFK